MYNIANVAEWVESILGMSTNDLVEGGVNGVSTKGLTGLTRRTNYLKDGLDLVTKKAVEDAQINSHLDRGTSTLKMKHIKGVNADDFIVVTPLGKENYARLEFKSGQTGTGIAGLQDTSEFSRVVSVKMLDSYVFKQKQYTSHLNIADDSDAGAVGVASGYWKIARGKKLVYGSVQPNNGKIGIELLTSSGSASEAHIYLDGVRANIISTKSTEANMDKREVVIYIDSHDKERVDVTIAQPENDNNTNANAFVYVRSVGYVELRDMTSENLFFDTIESGTTTVEYTATKGSSDFALYDTDLNGFCLSYHGGEEQRAVPLILGDACSLPITGGMGKVSTKVEIHQKTKLLNDKLFIDTVHTILDGGYKLDVALKGDINTNGFYTCMNTTHPTFENLYVPDVKTLIGTDNDLHEYLGDKKVGEIVQGNGTHSVTTRFTVFENDAFVDNGNIGAYIRKHTSYLKPYYGWVKGETKNLKELSFSSVRLYT